MSNIRTVTLELMRHGTGFVQVLAPSTDYLALCGDHPPEAVSIPAEQHFALAAGHRGLRYQDSEETRELQLLQVGSLVSMLLGRIPGLLAEMAAGQAAEVDLLHLRLVMTGPELALLPFELADTPRGAPGAGSPIALQGDLPVCITRQVRRVGQRPFSWPVEPRILLIAAAPQDAGDVPLQEHVDALSEIVEPWLPFADDAQERRRHLRRLLTVVPRADLHQIEDICRHEPFTHVHILAHGAVYRRGGLEHYGLALHDPDDPGRSEIVDGERLALALGAHNAKSGPDVVTLASCDSANPGPLIDGGSSVAHSLHRVGIPMVVASQFPLSKAGSVLLTRHLYDRLLWGSDPRRALFQLRRELRLRLPRTHDWAAVVVYTALPTDIGAQVDRYRIQRADAAVHNALDRVDHLVRLLQGEPDMPGFENHIETTLGHLLRAKDRLARRRMTPGALGLMAGAEKREAQMLDLASRFLDEHGEQAKSALYRKRSDDALGEAQELYRKVFHQDLRQSWAVAQYLSLCAVRGLACASAVDFWRMAETAARLDGESADAGPRQAWGHGTRAELYALAPCFPELGLDVEHCVAQARDEARKLARLVDRHPIDVYTTRQQFRRYLDWYRHLCDHPSFHHTVSLADEVWRSLPAVSIKGPGDGAPSRPSDPPLARGDEHP